MRLWSNKCEKDNSIHVIGNGKMLVYGEGPNIRSIQGPPYTSPYFCSLQIDSGINYLESSSERKSRTAIWNHTISDDLNIDSALVTVLTDYMDVEHNVFIRHFNSYKSLKYKILIPTYVRKYFYRNYNFGDKSSDCLMLCIPKGTLFFTSEATISETRMYILLKGNATFSEDGTTITMNEGIGDVIFATSYSPIAYQEVEYALKENANIYEKCKEYWHNFICKGKDICNLIPVDHPNRKNILSVWESVAILIKCQQSESGGVIAGHYYPMAYVRDQAGVVRGLLAMGYNDEAKKILDFWFAKWTIFGNLKNAEGMSCDHVRLLFPNDEVEIPAYVIMSAFKYLEVTKDVDYIKQILPMLMWAYKVQLPHLVNGMTGFSGDETYIAGLTFPREFIYQGSAESTLLFIESGTLLLDFIKENKVMKAREVLEYRNYIKEAVKKYKRNFVSHDIFYINNPNRDGCVRRPRFKHGYCEIHMHRKNCESAPLTWLERASNGYYICPECWNNNNIKQINDPNKRYILGSVALLPSYYNSNIFDVEDLKIYTGPVIDTFEKYGYATCDIGKKRALGYDFGLMLYHLTKINHHLKETALNTLLEMNDSTGAWVEYYDEKVPTGCRCRPWESAINIEAIFYYLSNLNDTCERGSYEINAL